MTDGAEEVKINAILWRKSSYFTRYFNNREAKQRITEEEEDDVDLLPGDEEKDERSVE